MSNGVWDLCSRREWCDHLCLHRGRLGQHVQHPVVVRAIDLVAPPVVVVCLKRVRRDLTIQIARLHTGVGTVRQLRNQPQEASEVGDGAAVELHHPMLGHQLVLVSWGAKEVV
eukprot:CAMPEP_0181191728 /NCGR_PEP_ID=MMETSP1096-20121128/12889_1 /TAXON_ID=156174 ORGANISM="Chrysochromulina ericina, Strain CCMP281" /NCGR_SAMPLE_ID=MMETSP1096 /ASSEMBLY_ACC=CAM_ASM_000453 /LENGTH=112 /DNA_ID=CAMNT_0023281045 /DNA_START=266 /DNA_END=604 /DNA_ORIENTATION=-